MTGLRKVLLYMLVICTLGYSSAWAYDGHAFDTDGQVVSSNEAFIDITSGGQTPGQQSAVDDVCDHCCHISSHLVAIFTQNSCSYSANQTSKRLDFSESLISFIVSPDLRPPRV